MNELCQKGASILVCGAQRLSASLLGSEVDNRWRGQSILPLIEVSTLDIDLSRELFCTPHQVDGLVIYYGAFRKKITIFSAKDNNHDNAIFVCPFHSNNCDFSRKITISPQSRYRYSSTWYNFQLSEWKRAHI